MVSEGGPVDRQFEEAMTAAQMDDAVPPAAEPLEAAAEELWHAGSPEAMPAQVAWLPQGGWQTAGAAEPEGNGEAHVADEPVTTDGWALEAGSESEPAAGPEPPPEPEMTAGPEPEAETGLFEAVPAPEPVAIDAEEPERPARPFSWDD